jgi:hypothetical protein
MAGFHTRPWGVQELLISLESRKLVLPEFQRDFVWNPKDIDLLLVSLASGYPAGSLLFLKTGGTAALGWRPVSGVDPGEGGSPDHLVLDGQQRVTSLALALQGRGEHLFFLDLDRFGDDGLENAVIYVRRDQAQKRALLDRWMQFEQHMYPFSAVFADNVDDENWFEDYVEHHHDEHDADRNELRAAARAMKKQFVEPLRKYEFPVVELPAETSLDAVCTIFETLNKTGMKLTVFDLLTAKFWPRGLHLREMLESARETYPLLSDQDFAIEANYLLQAISLLRSQDAPKCKRGDVLELSPENFAEDWARVCQAASSALTVLRDDCGVLGPAWMPYMALLPCLFATVVRVREMNGPKQAAAWQKVKQWFWCCCFGQRYEGPVNTLNAADYRALLLWLEDDQSKPDAVSGFALDELELGAVRRQRAAVYRAVICLTVTHGARDFHSGQRLTAELLRDTTRRIEDHHIVPTGFLKKQTPPLKGEDSILNRCLIDGVTNRTISDKAPHLYLKEIAAGIGSDQLEAILESHLIPAGASSALRRDPFDLPAFLSERNRHLLPKIATVTGADTAAADHSDAYLDPSRPFSNELALRRVLGRLSSAVFWYEQHMPSKALDVLSEALDRERVTSISVLSGPSNITPKAKKTFQRFKTEMTNDGIACEWRVLTAAASRELHARVLFDDQLTFELPPLNSLLAGTVDSIRESDMPHDPFVDAWERDDATALQDFEPTSQDVQTLPTVDVASATDGGTERNDSQGAPGGTHPSGPTRQDPTIDAEDASEQAGQPSTPQREPWTADEMVASIRSSQGAGAANAAQTILSWAADHNPQLRTWFSHNQTGSFMPGLDIRGGAYLFPIAIYSRGGVEIQFQHMIGRPQRPFEREEKRRELQRMLNEIDGVAIPSDRLDKRPGFPLTALAGDGACGAFLKAIDWAFTQAIENLDQERARLANEPSILLDVTDGAARRHYIVIRGHEAFFPADAFGGSSKSEAGQTVSLHFAGTNETVETDITDWQGFRARSPIGRFFTFHDIKGGEQLTVERVGDREYRLEPARA